MQVTVSKTLFWGVMSLLAAGVGVGIYVVSPDQSKPKQPPAPATETDQLSRFATGRTDKGFPGHWYTEAYDRFLRPWRDQPIRILEIGIADGGSLLMWLDYFPKATIHGIDIADGARLENARVRTCVADQAKRDQLKRCLDKFGGQFDLLIDDGGHSMEQQQVSFGFLFPYVLPGGFYSIEDLHTSMPEIYPDYGVESDGANTTLAMIESYIHTAPPVFKSKYILPHELAYLNAEVATTDLRLANNQGHSMMAVFLKRREGTAVGAGAGAGPGAAAPAGTASATESSSGAAPVH